MVSVQPQIEESRLAGPEDRPCADLLLSGSKRSDLLTVLPNTGM